jgi:hypothetical protein
LKLVETAHLSMPILPNADRREIRAGVPEAPRWIARWTYGFVLIAGGLLVVAHSLKVSAVRVDSLTVGLLALMLILPLAPYITRLSAGGFEAEIGRREAQDLQAAAVNVPPLDGGAATNVPAVRALIERDPPLGLAQLHIDLEREIHNLALAHGLWEPQQTPPPFSVAVRLLESRGVLMPELAEPLMKVWRLTSRALHGEYVPAEVAEDIATVGLRILGALRVISPAEGQAALQELEDARRPGKEGS